jgi:hypothetical protein
MNTIETQRAGLRNVRRRSQKVIAEKQDDGSYLLMTEDGQIDMAVSRDAALAIIKRRAKARNPGITITTIEWRD